MTEKVKVCMIGATGAGKTSLVSRYVSSIFSERYSTTIGVKIQARQVSWHDRTVNVVLWDLSGEDEFQAVQPAHLRGAAGYVLVIDGTRRETLATAVQLQARARVATGNAPFVVVVNKVDLVASWELDDSDVSALRRRGWTVICTSAKAGDGVADAFAALVDAIFESRQKVWT